MGADPNQLNGLVNSEVNIGIDNYRFWMPIQAPLLEAFEKEAADEKEILIYAMASVSHIPDENPIVYFLVSEFTTEWK